MHLVEFPLVGGKNATYSVDVLALQLADQGLETIFVRLNTDSTKDLLDVGGGGVSMASHLEEQVCSDMAHLEKLTKECKSKASK